MAKPLEPYKCSFSISYEIANKLSQTTYALGQISTINHNKAGDKEFADSTIYLLQMLHINLRATEMRGLRQGDEVPSAPMANALFKLLKLANRLDPYSKDILTTFENAIWSEGVPHRLSRKPDDFPYPVPMPARVETLLDGVFRYAKANQKRIHPLILSCVVFFEIVSIAPYSQLSGLAAAYVAKAILVNYDPIFALAPVERYVSLSVDKANNAFKESAEKGDMAPLISFLLSKYEEALIHLRKYKSKPVATSSRQVERMLSLMEEGKFYSASELCTLLGLKSRLGVQLNYIRPALEGKRIKMSNPVSPTDRNQRYKKA